MECKPLQTAHAAGVQTTRPVVRLCRLQRPVVFAACTACCTPLPLATACGLCRLHGLWSMPPARPVVRLCHLQRPLVFAACTACGLCLLHGLWSLPLARPVVRLCRLQRLVVYAACTVCCTPLSLATACGLCRCTACGTPLPLATACGLCRLHGLWYASAACNGLKGQ